MFRFDCGVLAASHRLVGARWTEGLSERFRVEVFVVVPAADAFDPEEALWLDAGLHIETPRGDAPFFGVVGECEEVFSIAGGADDVVGSAGTYYRMVMVPRVERLVDTLDSRVWVGKTLLAIFEDVFTRGGLAKGREVELKFADRGDEAQVVQYKESDFDFLARWMEREGIYFHFRHEDDVDALHLVDDWGQHDEDLGTFRYHAALGDDGSSGEAFHRFSEHLSMGPEKVKILDRDYHPAPTAFEGEHALAQGPGHGTLRRFGVRAFEGGKTTALAQVASEALDAERHFFVGEGGVVGVRPGRTFALLGHAIGRLDARYRVTSSSGVWNEHWQDGALSRRLGLPTKRLRTRVIAIAEGRPFRAPQRTPWPHVPGLETAFVDGEGGGDYAQLDDAGRYVVRFRFDGATNDPGKASTRIRMAQPHAGAPEGWHFPLRKETEVMTTFVHGDPDRALILGAVPNPKTPSAVTSANGTKNILRTGGTTRLEIEDQDGSQWAWLWTPVEDTYLYWGKPSDPTHNVVAHTRGNAFYDIGSNQDVRVGGDLTEQVTGAVTETYDTEMDTFVDGPQITIVTGDVQETYGATQKTTTTGAVLEIYGATQVTEVASAGRKETFDGGQMTVVNGAIDETVAGGMNKKVSGPTVQAIAGGLDTTVAGGTTQTFQSVVLQNWGPTDATIANLDIDVPGGVVHIGTTVTINSPGKGWLGTVKTIVVQHEISAHWFLFETYPLKAEANAFALGATGLKAELNGLLAEAVGFEQGFGPECTGVFVSNLGTWALKVMV